MPRLNPGRRESYLDYIVEEVIKAVNAKYLASEELSLYRDADVYIRVVASPPRIRIIFCLCDEALRDISAIRAMSQIVADVAEEFDLRALRKRGYISATYFLSLKYR